MLCLLKNSFKILFQYLISSRGFFNPVLLAILQQLRITQELKRLSRFNYQYWASFSLTSFGSQCFIFFTGLRKSSFRAIPDKPKYQRQLFPETMYKQTEKQTEGQKYRLNKQGEAYTNKNRHTQKGK